jgi:hypothetical protein
LPNSIQSITAPPPQNAAAIEASYFLLENCKG